MINNQGHPELIELIVLGLRSWHSSLALPLEYDILEPSLQIAYRKQRRIGWRPFIEGLWALDWRICQKEYLDQCHSQKSSILWISRVQRKIWHIAWTMWEQRNEYLHHKGETIHAFEMRALDIEIRAEWETGMGQLPVSYNYLFHGLEADRLNDTIKQKIMWITSVWTARDNEIHIGPPRERHRDIISIYQRWKKKNDVE